MTDEVTQRTLALMSFAVDSFVELQQSVDGPCFKVTPRHHRAGRYEGMYRLNDIKC